VQLRVGDIEPSADLRAFTGLLDHLEDASIGVDVHDTVHEDVALLDGEYVLSSTMPLLMSAQDDPALSRRQGLITRSPELAAAVAGMLSRRGLGQTLLEGRTVSGCRTCGRPQKRVVRWTRKTGRSTAFEKLECGRCHISRHTGRPLDDLIGAALRRRLWRGEQRVAAVERPRDALDRSFADIRRASARERQTFTCTGCWLDQPMAAASSVTGLCVECG
jgi:hypothetical protein